MILFDGCSWTYGDELEDREKYRFSTLVAKEHNHINIAVNGKSNDSILRTTIDYCENNQVDFAVIQFTKPSRTEIRQSSRDAYDYLSVGNIFKNGPRKTLSKIYYEHLHNDNLHVANFHKNKFLLENYFKSKNIKYYFVTIKREIMKIESSWYRIMDKKPITCLTDLIGTRIKNPENYCQGRYKKDDMRSGGHPNELGHKIIADHISLNIGKELQ